MVSVKIPIKIGKELGIIHNFGEFLSFCARASRFDFVGDLLCTVHGRLRCCIDDHVIPNTNVCMLSRPSARPGRLLRLCLRRSSSSPELQRGSAIVAAFQRGHCQPSRERPWMSCVARASRAMRPASGRSAPASSAHAVSLVAAISFVIDSTSGASGSSE
jgi:hypothetical protein